MKLELHLNCMPLPASLAKRIKAAGGRYTNVRGTTFKRYVTVPVAERDLIERLVREFATNRHKVTVVARHDNDEPYEMHHLPAWVDVQYLDCRSEMPIVEQFERKFSKALAQAVERKLVRNSMQERS